MNEFELLFTTIYVLKKLLDITAFYWNLKPETDIIVNSSYGITSDGHVLGNENGMLNTVQKISCMVSKNNQNIKSITLLHDGEKGTLLCQAYNNLGKPVFQFQHKITRYPGGNEIKNYINSIINI